LATKVEIKRWIMLDIDVKYKCPYDHSQLLCCLKSGECFKSGKDAKIETPSPSRRAL